MTSKYPGCKCDECPFNDREIVPPEGPDDAEILFLGQAPARNEVRLGRPFTGPSGQAFISALEEHHLKRNGDEFPRIKVDNTILCFFEGGERLPREAVEACRGHLNLQAPKVIVPMGNDAMGVVTDVWDGIMRVANIAFGDEKQAIVPLVHPAFYIRSAPNHFRDFKDGIGLVADIARGKTYFHLGQRTKVLTTKEEALELLKWLKENPPADITVDLETDCPDIASAKILCVALAWEETDAVVIPWDTEYLRQHGEEYPGLLDDQEVFEAFKEALEAQTGIICHNGQFDASLLLREGVKIYVKNDTLIMHYCLDERQGAQGLKFIAKTWLGQQDWEAELYKYIRPNSDDPYDQIPPRTLFPYAGSDACVTLALKHKLQRVMDLDENEGPKRLYNGSGHYPGLMAIARMFIELQPEGVRMDIHKIGQALREMPGKLEGLREELRRMTGNEFYNPGSVNDNRYYLFEKFGLPKIKGDSTDKDVLEALEGQHPFVDLLQEYRSYLKVCNTYIVNIAKSYRSGRGYPDFKLFGTVTGRLSANRLNPLVFPRESRGDLYSIVKHIFIADEDCFLMQSDYSGMEFRVGAVLSQDPWMLENLRDPEFDIHSAMAAQIFGETFRQADAKRRKELRVIAKMLVFGLNFGRGALSIGRQLGCSKSKKQQEATSGEWDGVTYCERCDKGLLCRQATNEAEKLVHAYFKPIPIFKKWRDEKWRQARTLGYLENPFGRRRRWDLITQQNFGSLSTQSVNTDTQSTANDCNLATMYRLKREMGDLVRPLWPIHDSILMNVSLKATPKDVSDIMQILRETPQLLLDTDLPFFIDVDVGFRWGELKHYEEGDPIPTPPKELLTV